MPKRNGAVKGRKKFKDNSRVVSKQASLSMHGELSLEFDRTSKFNYGRCTSLQHCAMTTFALENVAGEAELADEGGKEVLRREQGCLLADCLLHLDHGSHF